MTPEQIIAALRQVQEALRQVIEDGVQQTHGVYSPKNNKCVHGKYGYEGCEDCIVEFISTETMTKLPAIIAAVEAHEQLLNTVLIAWGRHLGGWDESKATPEDMEAYKYLHGEVTGHDTAAAKAHRCPTVKLDHIATSEESNSYICPECMRVYLVKNGDGQ